MTVKTLKEILDNMPNDAQVVVFDYKRNDYHADADGTSEGVYADFEINLQKMVKTETEKTEDVVSISFESDYAEEGSYLMELYHNKR